VKCSTEIGTVTRVVTATGTAHISKHVETVRSKELTCLQPLGKSPASWLHRCTGSCQQFSSGILPVHSSSWPEWQAAQPGVSAAAQRSPSVLRVWGGCLCSPRSPPAPCVPQLAHREGHVLLSPGPAFLPASMGKGFSGRPFSWKDPCVVCELCDCQLHLFKSDFLG